MPRRLSGSGRPRAPHDDSTGDPPAAAVRNKLTATLLQLEVAREVATDPYLSARIEAALDAVYAAALLLDRRV